MIKLASLLGLDENDPKRIYDAIVAGEKLDGGRVLDKTEQLRVYSGMFQTAYLNASISEDEYFVVAYLRLMFQIDDDENDAVINAIHDELEEHVEKNVFQVVEKGLDQAKDVVDGLATMSKFFAVHHPEYQGEMHIHPSHPNDRFGISQSMQEHRWGTHPVRHSSTDLHADELSLVEPITNHPAGQSCSPF